MILQHLIWGCGCFLFVLMAIKGLLGRFRVQIIRCDSFHGWRRLQVLGHKTDCDFWGYHGQPFYSEITTQSWNYKIKSGCQGMMRHIDLPMHRSLWNPREFPSKPRILAEVQPWNRLAKTRWKRRRILSLKKSQANRLVQSLSLVWRIYLGFLDISGMYWIPKPAPFLIT